MALYLVTSGHGTLLSDMRTPKWHFTLRHADTKLALYFATCGHQNGTSLGDMRTPNGTSLGDMRTPKMALYFATCGHQNGTLLSDMRTPKWHFT